MHARSSARSAIHGHDDTTNAEGAVPRDLPALVDHIVERYHRTHLRELPVMVALARDVEQQNASDSGCPIGLADHLAAMAKDLEAHQLSEEINLFPMIRIGTPRCLQFVRQRMIDDHIQMDVRLMTLERFTERFWPRLDAPFDCQALAFMCRKFIADLREHARLEHEVLYVLQTS